MPEFTHWVKLAPEVTTYTNCALCYCLVLNISHMELFLNKIREGNVKKRELTFRIWIHKDVQTNSQRVRKARCANWTRCISGFNLTNYRTAVNFVTAAACKHRICLLTQSHPVSPVLRCCSVYLSSRWTCSKSTNTQLDRRYTCWADTAAAIGCGRFSGLWLARDVDQSEGFAAPIGR